LDFGSISFLLYFLPIFFFFYAMTPKNYKNLTLIVGSAVFYTMGQPRYFFVIPLSMVINSLVGEFLEPKTKKGAKKNKQKRQKQKIRRGLRTILFVIAIIGNVSVLLFFKLSGKGLLLGLSFYTFQVISYLTDVYRGEVPAEHGFGRFIVFMGMFPKIGSGPITQYKDIRKELRERCVNADMIQGGLKLFILGLSAKVLLADRLGILWHEMQVTGYESITAKLAWIGAGAYSLKLYFDFYGYSLMAIGLGKLMGFELPENFRVPYMARNVKEFYRRWHITLGTWFKKYVYIPLGGSRKGETKTIRNLLIVWLLTGFWHGISANFLIWATFLCLCILLERQAEKFSLFRKLDFLPRLYLWVVIPVSWVMFAITDLDQLQIYLTRMFGIGDAINFNPYDWLNALEKYGILLAVGAFAATGLVEKLYKRFGKTLLADVTLAVLFWVCVSRIEAQGNNPFMYLNF